MWGITRNVVALILLVNLLMFPSRVLASSLSPASGDVAVMSGGNAEHTVTIFNNESDTIIYNAKVIGVEIGSDQSDLSFFELPEETSEWVDLSLDRFQLEPGEEHDLTVQIFPPDSLDSQVLVLGIQIVEEAQGPSGIQVGSGFVSMVFVTIGDDVPGEVEVLDFTASKTFVSELPISFLLTVRNSGERVVQPYGTIEVNDVFGRTVQVLDLNPSEKRVVSGQTRTFVVDWNEQLSLLSAGVYKIELRATPWIHGDEFAEELTVVIVPIRTIILLGAFLALLILILRYSSVSKRKL